MKRLRFAYELIKYLTFVTLLVALAGCASTYVDQRSRSPHYKDGKFTNGVELDKTWWGFIAMRISTEYSEWPDWVESSYGSAAVNKVSGNKIRTTLINHATVLIQTNDLNILTDPVYSDRTSPLSFLGPKRVRNPGLKFDDLPKIDVVIISHDHYDHLDLATIERLVARDNPKIYLGLGVGERLESMENVKELDWWESAEVETDFSLTFVPVQHFSGRTPFDRYSTLWGGFMLEIGKRKIYFGGDSGYAEHYQKTYEKFGIIDLAFLPIGAYAPQDFMGYAHMNPEEAIKAHQDLHAEKSIGIHYGTFQLTQEAINEPVEWLIRERKKAGIAENSFVLLEHGQPITISSNDNANQKGPE
ncbi:MAG: MBL fold metallo-hydrolase [Gammaproteobacteria bacterium]